MEVHIYLAVDSRYQTASTKKYGYVNDCMFRGELQSVEGFGCGMLTYHQAMLLALTEAVHRINKADTVVVHSEDVFILQNLKKLDRMAEDGFKKQNGRPVAGAKEWEKIYKKCGYYTLETVPGRHSYLDWLESEMRKRDLSEKSR